MHPFDDKSQPMVKEYVPEERVEETVVQVRERYLCHETHAVAHNGEPMTWKSRFSLVRDDGSPTLGSGFFTQRNMDDGFVAGKECFLTITEAT